MAFNTGTKNRLTMCTAASPTGVDYDDLTFTQITELMYAAEAGRAVRIAVQGGIDFYPPGTALIMQQRTIPDDLHQFVELWQHAGTDELYLGDPDDTEHVWRLMKPAPERFHGDARDLLVGDWVLTDSEYLTETLRDAPELVLELAAVYRRHGGTVTADVQDHAAFRQAYATVRERAADAHRTVLAATGGLTDAAITYITGQVRNPDA